MKLSDFDNQCIELLDASPDRKSKHCFRSAINHLARAEGLFPIDSAMAVFRCYTAEEEAASGLMHCLKDGGYTNADKLKPRDHVQKNAVIQFFSVLSQFVEDKFKDFGVELFLNLVGNADGSKRLAFEVRMSVAGEQKTFVPDPPLNFAFVYKEKRFSYKQQIAALIDARGAKNIEELLRGIANQRNLLLYTTENGYPSEIDITDKFFPAYQKRVFALIRAYLLIEPYKVAQPFVQDTLDDFLAMLNKLPLIELHDEF